MRDRRFQVKITGENVSPETVSIGDLLEAMRRLELAAAATAREFHVSKSVDLKFSLVAVEDKCDLVTLAASATMLQSVKTISVAVHEEDYQTLPLEAVEQLRRLWSRARESQWETVEIVPNGEGIAPAVIRSDAEFLPLHTFVEPGTIYGICQHVGGKKRPTAKIQVIDGPLLTVGLISKSFARQLSEHLYEPVGLEGTATWDYATRQLVGFDAKALTGFKGEYSPAGDVKQDIVAAFDRLAAASGDRWNEIDPDEYVRELRRD